MIWLVILAKTFYTNVAVSGDYILYRGFHEGLPIQRKVKYQPIVYIEDNGATFAPNAHKSLSGKHLQPYHPGSIKETKELFERYKDVDGMNIYGLPKFPYAYIADEFGSDPIEWDVSLVNVANIDIEVGRATGGGYALPENPTGELTAITIKQFGVYHVFGCGDFNPTLCTVFKTNPNADIRYNKCDNEVNLLKKFIGHWSFNKRYPDIITGWNVKFFDIPYLINRINRVLGGEKASLDLSSWGRIYEKTTSIMNK